MRSGRTRCSLRRRTCGVRSVTSSIERASGCGALTVQVRKANVKTNSRTDQKDLWKQRFDDINNFERYLTNNGIVILKFFLHVSKEEQKQRFLARIDDPRKNWKFSMQDVKEREHWDEYMHAYEQTVRHTATEHAPWYVVPADKKWFTRLVVASAIVQRLSALDLSYPKLSKDEQLQLKAAKQALESETQPTD